ncbi:MAG TPA: DUF4268 domain-containing protein [Ohtaekwangia sp.]
MFSREESSRIKEEFWTAFGKYMTPVPSAEDIKINWVNYHTGLKDVYFRMDARNNGATIFISLEHRDSIIRELYFEQFLELKTILHTMLDEEWQWQLHAPVQEGKVISRIDKTISGVSIFNKDHWPALISFFKPRIITLDEFWVDAKYTFESLK